MAGLIELILVMPMAFRWGFAEAAVASLGAVACLDFFYMPPIFSLRERDPQDWISSAIFATIALLASHLADRLRKQAIDTSKERTRLERLYLTSRDIIMMDCREDIGAQLTNLIHNIFKVDAVALWDARELKMDRAGKETICDEEVRATYFREISENNLASRRFKRVLRLGVRSIGALYIDASGDESDLDPRSVDAIASLATLALERAHSFIAKSNTEAARRSEELRSTVLDGLAHAFKTPLATIQAASSGLLEIPQLEPVGRELASLIEEQAERLTYLTNSMLQTAELDEKQMQIHCDRIDLEQLIQQCKEWFARIVTDHCLVLSEEASIDYVCADSRLLQMALFQLLDNAAKYSRPASPITLRTESTDVEVVFSVHNEGSYITTKERRRIFERFYRSSDTQHKAAGTGIGLSVTRRIVEAHGGRVWVESEPAANTTFSLALPLVQTEA